MAPSHKQNGAGISFKCRCFAWCVVVWYTKEKPKKQGNKRFDWTLLYKLPSVGWLTSSLCRRRRSTHRWHLRHYSKIQSYGIARSWWCNEDWKERRRERRVSPDLTLCRLRATAFPHIVLFMAIIFILLLTFLFFLFIYFLILLFFSITCAGWTNSSGYNKHL